MKDDSNSRSDLESMSIIGSSGAFPSQSSLIGNDSTDLLNKPDMCDQATQVTEDDDEDDGSRITSESHDENVIDRNYLITRSGNVIYKDM